VPADLSPKKMRFHQHMPARQHGRQVSNPPYGVAHRIKSGIAGPNEFPRQSEPWIGPIMAFAFARPTGHTRNLRHNGYRPAHGEAINPSLAAPG